MAVDVVAYLSRHGEEGWSRSGRVGSLKGDFNSRN